MLDRLLHRLGMGCMSISCHHVHKSTYHNNHHRHHGCHCGHQKNRSPKENASCVVTVDMMDVSGWEDQGKQSLMNYENFSKNQNGSISSHRLVKSMSSINDPNVHEDVNIGLDENGDDLFSQNNPNKRNQLPRRSIKYNGDNNNDGSSSNNQNYSEIPRFILSYAYMALCGFANSLVVILAHDAFPQRSKYPPLPDLLLDNLPYKKWAFPASEACVGCLSVIMLVVLSVHKHRFVIMRRMFIIYGTVLIMRCPSMLLTSLSVCNEYMECDPQMNDTAWSKLKRAGDVYTKLGLSTRGVRTCGDYMFSGHTVIVSLLNYSITEHSPLLIVHLITWSLTITTLILIMVGHAHYSIDVVIAFFITSLYFNYYHTLTNNYNPTKPPPPNQNTFTNWGGPSPQQLQTSPTPPSSSLLCRVCFIWQRNRIWVPFYSYLEGKTGGQPLPHEYESPIVALLKYFRRVKHRVIHGKVRQI